MLAAVNSVMWISLILVEDDGLILNMGIFPIIRPLIHWRNASRLTIGVVMMFDFREQVAADIVLKFDLHGLLNGQVKPRKEISLFDGAVSIFGRPGRN